MLKRNYFILALVTLQILSGCKEPSSNGTSRLVPRNSAQTPPNQGPEELLGKKNGAKNNFCENSEVSNPLNQFSEMKDFVLPILQKISFSDNSSANIDNMVTQKKWCLVSGEAFAKIAAQVLNKNNSLNQNKAVSQNSNQLPKNALHMGLAATEGQDQDNQDKQSLQTQASDNQNNNGDTNTQTDAQKKAPSDDKSDGTTDAGQSFISIQTSDEIIIDHEKFNNLESKQRSELLLKEIMKSFYMLRFKKVSEACEVYKSVGEEKRCEVLKEASQDPAKVDAQLPPEAVRALTENEENKLQELSHWLINIDLQSLTNEGYSNKAWDLGLVDKKRFNKEGLLNISSSQGNN